MARTGAKRGLRKPSVDDIQQAKVRKRNKAWIVSRSLRAPTKFVEHPSNSAHARAAGISLALPLLADTRDFSRS